MTSPTNLRQLWALMEAGGTDVGHIVTWADAAKTRPSTVLLIARGRMAARVYKTALQLEWEGAK